MNHKIYDDIKNKTSFKNANMIGIEKQQKHIAGKPVRRAVNTQTKTLTNDLEGSSQAHLWNPAEMGDSRIRGVESIRSTYFDTEFEDDEWED